MWRNEVLEHTSGSRSKRCSLAAVSPLWLCGIGAAFAQAPAAPASVATAFVDVSVIPMDRQRVLRDQMVVVRGDRIVAIGSAGEVRIPREAVQVDGRGKFLIPGLADMHAHLGYPTALDSTAMADLLFVLVANGVTTVRDMHSGGRPPPPESVGQRGQRRGPPPISRQARLLSLRQQVASGDILGPRIYTAGDPDKSSPAAAARSVVELEADGHDFVKMSGIRSREIYDSLIAAAHRVGLRVVGHAPSLEGGVLLPIDDHWASMEHLYQYMETLLGLSGHWDRLDGRLLFGAKVDTFAWAKPGFRLDSTKLRTLALATRQAGVWNCPTLIQRLSFGFLRSVFVDSTLPATIPIARSFTLDLQVLRALHDAGAGILLGTDFNFGPDPGFSVHEELALLVRLGGLTPYEALETGTRNVAMFLGALDSTGTIAVGKRADLVLLYGNPLEDIQYTAGPAGVMVGGRWLPRATLDARLDSLAARATSASTTADVTRALYGGLAQARQRVWRYGP